MKILGLLILLIPVICFGDAGIIGEECLVPAVGGGATISYIAEAHAAASGAIDLVVAVPTGTQNGDLMVLDYVSDQNTKTTVTGWTLIDEVTVSSSEHQMFYRIADSEPANYTVQDEFINSQVGTIMTFRKTSGTWDVATYSTNSAVSASITTTSVTGVADCMMVATYSNDGGGSVDTAPTDMTLVVFNIEASISGVTYYESRGAGAVTKTITYAASEDLTAIALIIKAT